MEKILFFFIKTAYTNTMKHIIDKHHEKIGIAGIVIVTALFTIIATTILPKKTLAPATPSPVQVDTKTEPTTKPIPPVVIETIQPNSRVSPKQVITGTVPGYYFFEESFPVTLRDINDKPFTTIVATTDEDWMVTTKVHFSITLPETFTYTGIGNILFKKDDPSDGEAPFDPEKDQYVLPVIFEN